MRIDEPHSLSGDGVGQILRFDQRIVSAHDRAVDRLLAPGGKEGMGSGQESVELVKASRLRMKVRSRPEMPLAKHARDVARLLQHIRQRDRRRIQAAIQADA